MKTLRYDGSPEEYERKLERVVARLGGERLNWDMSREGVWLEFWRDGQLYRFEHSKSKAAAHGFALDRMVDVLAQLVLGLEDLARLADRGIYELSTWLEGLKALPQAPEVPSFLRFMGFGEVPSDIAVVRARYKELAKSMHPDVSGMDEDMRALNEAIKRAEAFYLR